jgi:hypothetical protein
MTNDRAVERGILGTVLFYLILAHGVAAYLACTPGDAPLRSVLHLPTCAMRHYVGIPCPLCFGTTTYILIWRGYWGVALRLDPLVFAVFWESALLIPALAFLIVSRYPVSHWTGGISKRAWTAVAGTVGLAVLANWAYLIITLSDTSPEAVLASFP